MKKIILQFIAIYGIYLLVGVFIGIIGYFVISAVGISPELFEPF